MPIPQQRDPAVTRARLRDWLATKVPEARGLELSPLGGPAASGFSNETIIFDASWTDDGGPRTEGYVVRVQPTAYTVFYESWFERQYAVMKALREHTDVPLPPVHWFEGDPGVLGAPFFVMGKVEGQAPGDTPSYNVGGFLADASPAQQERLWWSGLDAMAKVHTTDWRALGLLPALDMPARGTGGLRQQLAYYEEFFEWAKRESGRSHDTGDQILKWMLANAPTSDPDMLSWGDSRIGNQLFHDFECRAVLDWEMVGYGDPRADLAWWLFLDSLHSDGWGNARLPGLPSHEATVRRWEELTGLEAGDLHWFSVFSGFRFLAVMIRLTTMAVSYGLAPPDTDAGEDNAVVHMTCDLLGIPRPG
jgi:aminoglycoside phosphotransferase (APT) family kinase protein